MKLSRASQVAMELAEYLPVWEVEVAARDIVGKIPNATRQHVVLALAKLEARGLLVSRPSPQDKDIKLYRPPRIIVEEPDPIQEFLTARLGVDLSKYATTPAIKHTLETRKPPQMPSKAR